MLTVWGRKNSSNVQPVMWCIAELGLAYKRHDVGGKFGGNKTKEFLAMNPNGTVPVIQDGEKEYLWESGTILRYLANCYGQPPFWPTSLDERTHIDKWAEWSKINIGLNFSKLIFVPLVLTSEENRNQAAIDHGLQTLTPYLDIAQSQLQKHAFLAGNALTLADIVFGSTLYRYFNLPIKRPHHPAVQAYYERLTHLETYQEHVMVSYEDLWVTKK